MNCKIEGFFDICKTRGLTGTQGVIIPAANQVHLMLPADLRDAVKAGKFHIYSVEKIEQLMSLLCGLPAGEMDDNGVYSEGSFNRRVCDRIEELQLLRSKYAKQAHNDGEGADEKDT